MPKAIEGARQARTKTEQCRTQLTPAASRGVLSWSARVFWATPCVTTARAPRAIIAPCFSGQRRVESYPYVRKSPEACPRRGARSRSRAKGADPRCLKEKRGSSTRQDGTSPTRSSRVRATRSSWPERGAFASPCSRTAVRPAARATSTTGRSPGVAFLGAASPRQCCEMPGSQSSAKLSSRKPCSLLRGLRPKTARDRPRRPRPLPRSDGVKSPGAPAESREQDSDRVVSGIVSRSDHV